MIRLDENTLSEVIKNILARDELEDADEITTMGIIDIIESSIIHYNELTKKKVNMQYKNRSK